MYVHHLSLFVFEALLLPCCTHARLCFLFLSCLFQDSFILRAYDNRVRETPRSPLLYNDYNGLKQGTTRCVEVVDDGHLDICEFGDLTSHASALSMVFCAGNNAKRGKVEVISVPFYTFLQR